VKPSEALRAVFDAWERRDIDALADAFTEDGAYEDPLQPTTIVGRDRIRDEFRGSLDELSLCEITLRHTIEMGDVGVSEGRFFGRLTSGGELDFAFAALAEMRDGRIARLGEYFDTRPLIG
jgi:ketosteroid isomerase-like protein